MSFVCILLSNHFFRQSRWMYCIVPFQLQGEISGLSAISSSSSPPRQILHCASFLIFWKSCSALVIAILAIFSWIFSFSKELLAARIVWNAEESNEFWEWLSLLRFRWNWLSNLSFMLTSSVASYCSNLLCFCLSLLFPNFFTLNLTLPNLIMSPSLSL